MRNETWPRVVLFDLDGTLVETLPDIQASANGMLAARGLAPLDAKTVRGFIGKGSRNLMQRCLETHGLSPTEADIDDALRDFTIHYDREPVAGSFVYDGVVPFLERLRAGGHRLAVCTNKQKGTAVQVLDALGILQYFEAVVGGDDVVHRKPDPRHIDHVLTLMDLERADALFVGDSENDIEAATAADIPCIAVTFGYNSVPLEELSTVALVDHYDEIWPHVAGLRT